MRSRKQEMTHGFRPSAKLATGWRRRFGNLWLATTVALAIVLGLTVTASQAAQAQTFKVVYDFTGGQDGGNPSAGVTMDKAGNLYGTAYDGGGADRPRQLGHDEHLCTSQRGNETKGPRKG